MQLLYYGGRATYRARGSVVEHVGALRLGAREAKARTTESRVQPPPPPISIWTSVVPACSHVSLLRDVH